MLDRIYIAGLLKVRVSETLVHFIRRCDMLEHTTDNSGLIQRANEWANRVDAYPPSQEINFLVTCHSSGETSSRRTTVGAFREMLRDALTRAIKENDCRLCIFPREGGWDVDLEYHDFFDIEVVTPAIAEREAHEAKIWKQIDDLKLLGVSPDLFVRDNEHDCWIGFEPAKVVEMAKVIADYLDGKLVPNQKESIQE
jgi:hypothetical protein